MFRAYAAHVSRICGAYESLELTPRCGPNLVELLRIEHMIAAFGEFYARSQGLDHLVADTRTALMKKEYAVEGASLRK